LLPRTAAFARRRDEAYRDTFYHITIRNGGAGTTIRRLTVNGVEQTEPVLTLMDDRRDHTVEIDLR